MPVLSGFVGSAYRPQGGYLDTQELINYYLERAESREARSPQALLPCPGFELFCTLVGTPVRGIFAQNNRTFAVGGENLYELSRTGVITAREMTVLATPTSPTITNSPLDEAIDAPTVPVITHGGTLGSTTYGYQITAVNENGETEGSTEGTSAYGNATLSGTNYNLVRWSEVEGATSYNIYRTTGGPTSVPRLVGQVQSNTLQFLDYGTDGTTVTVPVANTTGGVAGTTTYGYKITAVLGLGETAASAEGVTNTGQATLSADDYNIVTFPKVTNANSYNVYRTQGGVSPPRLIGSVTADTDEDEVEATLTFHDVGEEGESLTPPVSTTTGTASIENDSAPVQIVASGDAGNQLLIVGGGNAYCFDLTTNALAQVVEGATSAGYIGTYFVVLDAASSTLKVSESLDGFVWDASQLYQRSEAGDSWLSMAVTHAEIWLFGSATTEVWVRTSNDETRFVPMQGVFIEQGIIAPNSLVRLKGSLLWVGQNANGAGMIFRSEGYNAVQISTRGIELQLENLATLADAVAWGYEQEGHSFYVLSFPTDGVTWCFDMLTQEWHQRGYYDPDDMDFTAYRPQCHAFAFGGLGFGKHLVGDSQTGRILTMKTTLGTDVDGAVIRRVRQAPHLIAGPKKGRVFYDALFIDVQPGLGVEEGQGSDPVVMLRYSNDGGKTWSNERQASAGAQGQYGTRVHFTRLGSGRDRVFRMVVTDPIPWRVSGAVWEGEVTDG